MTPFLQLSLALAIIIAAAKAGGYISYRLGQPSVLGELIVGIILGPTIINILHVPYFSDKHLSEVVHHLAEIGVMMLMFLAGLELHISDLAKSGRVASFAGSLGVLIPLGLGTLLGLAFSMVSTEAIFIGLILSATSVSISAQTLIELNAIRSRVGIGLLGAAVFDDILVVLGLSVFTAIILASPESGLTSILIIGLRMLLFLLLAILIGVLLVPRLSDKVSGLPISQGLIALVLVFILIYGWTAEEIGHMAAITGAFMAGLMFGRTPYKDRIETGIYPIAYGFFVPIFFVNVGLQANGRELTGESLLLFITMSVVAIISKVLGSGGGALISGFSRREALQVGIGMMSRGEVGLIVATVGITEGVIPQSTFSAIIGVVIITTLLTPPLLRWSFDQKRSTKQKMSSPVSQAEGE